MNKKAFTLVEMIAVLVILSIIFVISFTPLTKLLKDGDVKINNAQKQLIKSAAKDYLSQNNIKSGCVTIQELIDKKLLTKKEVDKIDLNTYVNFSYESNKAKIEISKECNKFDPKKVKFSLIGESEMTISQGNTFSDPGVTAIYLDKDIKDKVKKHIFDVTYSELNEIPTDIIGSYIIEYSLSPDGDPDNVQVLERIVNVENSTNPRITHPGDTTISSSLTIFDILSGVKATSADGKELKVTATTDLSLGIEGTYTINYNAKDKDGNKTSCIRRINIVYQYKEDLLKGNDPVLDEGMIPVYYEGTTLKKANLKEKWYDYANKIYANAIIVKSEKRSYYKNLEPNANIDLADVLGYFVWIPKYKYKLLNSAGKTADYNLFGSCKVNCPQKFEIEFERASEISNGTTDGQWKTPAGFKFDGKNISGSWVGKFEVTGTASQPSVLPGINALTNQNISAQWNTSRLFNNNDYYGIKGDARMLRMSDWGIITYITFSDYGNNKKLYINNNMSNKTGCSAKGYDAVQTVLTSNCNRAYGTLTGNEYHQSTNDNITGIFDIAGSAFEYALGYLKGASTIWGGASDGNHAGFTTQLDSKYFDSFTSTNRMTACNGSPCLGYGLVETAGWYQAYNRFYDAADTPKTVPWMELGGTALISAVTANTNAVNFGSGAAHSYDGFRLIISK